MLLKRISLHTKKKISLIFYRRKILEKMRKECHNKNFTIISSNCIGGRIYHDLGMKFLSPTVNLYIPCGDFIRFCQNLKFYLGAELIQLTSDLPYPVGFLKGNKDAGIKIYFVHYKTFDEAKKKWEERKKRVNYQNLFIIMVDRDEFAPFMLEDFTKLEYPKLFYSSKDYDYDFSVKVSGFKNEKFVGPINSFSDYKGNRFYEKDIDIISWLNGD